MHRVIHTLRGQDKGTHLRKPALWLLPHATLRYVSLVILCIHRKVFWWTGRCCLYPLRDIWCDGLVRVRCDSIVLADHGVPFPCFRRGPYATQLDPWCGTLLWPDCTRSEEPVQNFHLSVTCHRHMGRSW